MRDLHRWEAHDELFDELKCKAWVWPVLFRNSTPLTRLWPDAQAQLWHALTNAVQEAQRNATRAKKKSATADQTEDAPTP